MALISGPKIISSQALASTSTVQHEVVGSRVFDNLGNQYIYLLGLAATAAGTWVTFNESYATALLTGDAIGPVAISMTANIGSQWGYYQISGINTIAVTDTIAADKQLYIDGTDGRADDADVAGDTIIGAISQTADTSNVATVWINHPFVTDVAID